MSNTINIPTSPDDRKALADGIKEICKSMTRAEGDREYQRESIKALAEKFNVEGKYIRRMATDYYKDTFDEKSDEHDEYVTLYEAVIRS